MVDVDLQLYADHSHLGLAGGRVSESVQIFEGQSRAVSIHVFDVTDHGLAGAAAGFHPPERARGATGRVALLHRIIPHLSSGLKAAVLCKQASTEPEQESVPGVLVLDDQGQVVQHTEAAERWLRDLAELGDGWLEGEGFPAPVWMIVGALRRALKPQNDRDVIGVPSVLVQTRSGRWLTFHGARTETRLKRGGETMVIIEPSRPQELAWLRASAYGLSERERAVVDFVVQGASTKEISRALYISEYTVQDHLSHAFDKVGVRGRRALLKRLFFDNLYPELFG